ncbi:MAG: hypothetical protein JW924_03405 [Fusobacteriaceae bacterium]|nr:hypothetical protein [Fusobacteriaceae bacterium]
MTFKQTYTQAQNKTIIITPTEGKKLYIWKSIINGDNSGKLEFIPSALIVKQGGGSNPNNSEGAIDEGLSLTCEAQTTIIILYDEI